MIEIKEITKVYSRNGQEFKALDQVSMVIREGDFLAVSGKSGAGKSTLLYAIAGLIRPDSGTVLFNGRDVNSMSAREKEHYRSRQIGFVFQHFHLMPWLNVYDNIRLGCNTREQAREIEALLETCNLTDLRKKYPSELSVGEKQRTAFIRAIISKPALLLADEPTGNLDAENSATLMELISGFNRNGGTVIVVSHHPEAGKYARQSVVIEKGRFVSN